MWRRARSLQLGLSAGARARQACCTCGCSGAWSSSSNSSEGLGLRPCRRRHGPPGPDRQQPPRHERPAAVRHAVPQVVDDGCGDAPQGLCCDRAHLSLRIHDANASQGVSALQLSALCSSTKVPTCFTAACVAESSSGASSPSFCRIFSRMWDPVLLQDHNAQVAQRFGVYDAVVVSKRALMCASTKGRSLLQVLT